jgi:hypothetical protein
MGTVWERNATPCQLHVCSSYACYLLSPYCQSGNTFLTSEEPGTISSVAITHIIMRAVEVSAFFVVSDCPHSRLTTSQKMRLREKNIHQPSASRHDPAYAKSGSLNLTDTCVNRDYRVVFGRTLDKWDPLLIIFFLGLARATLWWVGVDVTTTLSRPRSRFSPGFTRGNWPPPTRLFLSICHAHTSLLKSGKELKVIECVPVNPHPLCALNLIHKGTVLVYIPHFDKIEILRFWIMGYITSF